MSSITSVAPPAAVELFVWASSPKDAIDALSMPEDRCPRYVDICDALGQRDAGNDGYEGEGLYRAAIEQTAMGRRLVVEEIDPVAMFAEEGDAA